MNFKEFVDRVAEFEGFRSLPYKCPAGVWTIGYGRTNGVNENTPPTDIDTERAWLEKELTNAISKVEMLLPNRFNENQKQALASFMFNCGIGNLSKLTNYGKRSDSEISKMIPAYNKGGGKVLAGLVKRRAWEKNLFDNVTVETTVPSTRESVIAFKLAGKWWTHTGVSHTVNNNDYAVMIEVITDMNTISIGNSKTEILESDIVSHNLPMQFLWINI